jgi:hypothetical protein
MDDTRRSLLKKAAYAAPVILTVLVRPAFANGTYEPEPLKPVVGGDDD